jgi:hypothetical protein
VQRFLLRFVFVTECLSRLLLVCRDPRVSMRLLLAGGGAWTGTSWAVSKRVYEGGLTDWAQFCGGKRSVH